MTTLAETDNGSQSAILEVLGKLHIGVGKLTDRLNADAQRRQALTQAIHFIGNIPLPQITSSGVALDKPELMGPRLGKTWDVKRITCETFTGGTVNIYLDGVADSNVVMVFTTAGTSLLGKAQIVVEGGSRLIAQASSLTGNATISLGVVEVAAPWFSDYLL